MWRTTASRPSPYIRCFCCLCRHLLETYSTIMHSADLIKMYTNIKHFIQSTQINTKAHFWSRRNLCLHVAVVSRSYLIGPLEIIKPPCWQTWRDTSFWSWTWGFNCQTNPDSAEISIGEDHWGHQGPRVEEQTNPAGADLDPNCRPRAGDGVICIRAVGTQPASFIIQIPVFLTFKRFLWQQLSTLSLDFSIYHPCCCHGASVLSGGAYTDLYQLVSVIMMYSEARKKMRWKKE